MKTNNPLHRLTALLPVLLLATACTRDDGFAPSSGGDATPAALTISVTDGGYALADAAPGTRAVERGYGTEFTAGDQIGLYVVEVADPSNTHSDRKFLHQNLCLTYDGTAWTLPPGTDLTHCPPPGGGEVLYFAYYPYQGDMTGKVKLEMLNTMGVATFEAKWFFWLLIVDWYPAADQSTYKAYTASDLMIAKGKVTARTDGTDGSVLSFTMEHQMPLVVVRVPTTKCTYKETVSGVEQEKSYHLYSNSTDLFWKENHHTARFLCSPNDASLSIRGIYYSTSGEHEYSFVIRRGSISPGTYKLFTIDDGGEKVMERSLSVGDFYMKDGTILPKESVPGDMPRRMQKDCLGVVFWVGEKKDKYDQTTHWTRTLIKKGDALLMRDHPGCTHGLVVALKDAAVDKKPWSSSSKESTYRWLENYAATGQEAEKILILRSDYGYGYSPSRCLQWFRDYGNNPTEAYNAIEDFAKANPTPAGCSGWYFPGEYETTVMARGTLNDDLDMTATLNTQFGKAGGDIFKTDGFYWSSTDLSAVPGESYCINFSNNEKYRYVKNNVGYVRAVLAF